jgi:putative oxidoreductase
MTSAVMRGLERLGRDRWPFVPLRLMLGFGFAAHGLSKLERGPEHFAAVLVAMHVPMPLTTAWLITALELAGGVSLMVGAAVRPWTIPLAITMIAALVGVHGRYGFLSIRLKALTASGAEFGPVGYELNLLYLAGLVALGLAGSSPLSIDRWLERRRRTAPRHGGGGGGERAQDQARAQEVEGT